MSDEEAAEFRRTVGQALGLSFDDPVPTPGTVPVPGREFLYVSLLKPGRPGSAFNRVTEAVRPLLVKHGTAMEENCILTLPSGERFFGVSWKGDLEGWRMQLTQGAALLGLKTARIEDELLKVSDGREVAVADCAVEMW